MHQAVYMENCFNYFVMEYPLFDNIRWQFIVLCHELTYSVKHETESKNCYTESGVPYR
jgi:hypothetical protein